MTTTTYKSIRAERSALLPGARPRARISTDQLDSQRDRVLQAGLSFRSPMRVLLSHDAKTSLPVGLVSAIHQGARFTEAEWEWFTGDTFVDRVKNLYDQHAFDTSVGMQVDEAEPNSDGGFDIVKATVLEFSLTPIPANEGALALMKTLSSRSSEAPRGDDVVVVVVDDDDPDEQLDRQIERERIAGIQPSAATLRARRLKEIERRKHVTRDVTGTAPGGHSGCPGPSGVWGGDPPCPFRFPMPVSGCPGKPCPPRGENVFDRAGGGGRVPTITDDGPVTYVVDPDAVARTLREVVGEVVTKRTREAVTAITGRID